MTEFLAFGKPRGGRFQSISDSIWTDPNVVLEPKLDGARYMWYILDNHSEFRGRRKGKVKSSRFHEPGELVEKGDRVPQFTGIPLFWMGFADTVIDGEVVNGNNVHAVTSIMGAGPEKAVQRQQESGWARYVAFDILKYKGKDVRQNSYLRRRQILQQAITEMREAAPEARWDLVDIVPNFLASEHNIKAICKSWIDEGKEGGVIKTLDGKYGKGWTKAKRRVTADVVVLDYTEGNGKFEGKIGAIIFGVYIDGQLKPIGQCSGMTDEQRQDFTDNKGRYVGTVIEVSGQEITGHGRIREPQFERTRPDKSAEQCTFRALTTRM